MSKLKIIDTIKRSFNLLKKDPTLIVLFILPAIFSLLSQSIIVYLLSSLMFSTMMWDVPGLPLMLPVLLFILPFIVTLFFRVWASAGAILKITELEKGSKLGLKEALSKGLKKVPKLLVPAIVGLAISTLMFAGLTIAITNYPFVSMAPLVQDAGPSNIVPRVAMGFLFIIGLYVAIRLYLYAPACVLENNFGLKTSWKLVKGNWWKLFAIFLIFGAMSAIISQAYIIGSFLSVLIVGPFSITAKTLIYFQLREAKSSGEEELDVYESKERPAEERAV
jgi:hypothetical protein